MRTPSRKTFVFTLNNYTSEDAEGLQSRIQSLCTYGCFGKEVGSNGTPHLQGYVRTKERYNFCDLKQVLLNPRCHVEAARGSAGVNRSYCSKDGEFWEFGGCPGVKASKSRDELAREFISRMSDGGDGLATFAGDNPGTYLFSGHNMLRNYLRYQPAVDRPNISVRWFFGPPGVGKSRRAHEILPSAFIKEPRTKWWSGYQLEKTCIIDDFGPNGIDINHLLRWFDRYKCLVETKGDMVPLYVETFIVTSNFHPSQIFKFGEEVNPQLPALLRRIVIEEFE